MVLFIQFIFLRKENTNKQGLSIKLRPKYEFPNDTLE